MNELIQKFGQIVGKQAQSHPVRARRLLAAVYDLAGKQAQFFPAKILLPSRQYINGACSRSTVNSLRRPRRSAMVSLFLPCEVLHALGIEPLFPEGLACYLAAAASEQFFVESAEQHGVPESFCSYHKILIGLVESGVLPKPQFIWNTTLACDANQLSFRRAAEHWQVPHFVLDIPHQTTPDTVAYVAGQLRETARQIEALTGRVLEAGELSASVARSKRTIQHYRQYLSLRADRFLSDEMTSEMLSAFAMHVLLGTPEAETYTRSLAEEISALPMERPAVRLIWVHSLPYWQDSLRDILNFNSQYEIAACDMTFDSLTDLDENTPYESMARRVLECSFNGGARRRIDRIKEFARQMHADGIVYFCHWGCKQTMGMSRLAKKELEAEGFPTLLLDGDGCDTKNISDGQMVTRLQAFLEQLEGQR